MPGNSLPGPVLWLVIAFDLLVAVVALGLYSGLLPRFHPVLAQLPPSAYLVVMVVFAAGAALMALLQTRSRRP